MDTPGHYWCKKCDNPAYGEVCRDCGQTADFIPDLTDAQAKRVTNLAIEELEAEKPVKPKPAIEPPKLTSAERGKWWIEQLRAAANNNL